MLEIAAIKDNNGHLGPGYMANFPPGLKFQPGFWENPFKSNCCNPDCSNLILRGREYLKKISCNRNEILALAKKQKRFQWNKGDKLENFIHCLSKVKDRIKYKNIDFSADKVLKTVRGCQRTHELFKLEDISSFYASASFLSSQRFRFSSIIS